MSELYRVPEGVEEEWLEGGMLPASAYSQPLRGATFVPGWGRYTVPDNPQHRKTREHKVKSFQNPQMHVDLDALDKRTDIPKHMLGIMRGRIIQSFM